MVPKNKTQIREGNGAEKEIVWEKSRPKFLPKSNK